MHCELPLLSTVVTGDPIVWFQVLIQLVAQIT